MARTVRGGKSAAKKAASRKTAPKAKAPVKKQAAVQQRTGLKKKAAVTKKAAAPVRKSAVKARAKSATKQAAPKKKVATRAQAKKAVARVPAARRTTTRRTRVATPPRRKTAGAPRLKTAASVQHFTVSHLNDADFKQDGLRSYALYRDLGIAAGSGGLCQAHVIRMLSPCTDEVRKPHQHETELQLIYVLQGWVKNEFEGEGVQMMSAGSCWLQPPGIRHTVLDYSADVELLEIIVPADFKTVEPD
jgi:uncharacterized RmlC-like cupin family protein